MAGVKILGTARFGRGRLGSMVRLLIGSAILCSIALAQDEPTSQSTPQPSPRSSPQQGKSQPDQPSPNEKPQDEKQDKKKDDTSNPAQAAAEVTKQVAEATKNAGQAALVKARDWESGWFVGVYVEKGRPLVPMTEKQRREIYLQQILATPGAYLKRMFDAGIDQARDSPAQWSEGWGGYGARFASREGQFVAANSLAALGNAALRYEPRYDQCRCHGFWPRTRHAILRNFLTYDRSEQEQRPQLALYGGSFGGGMISTAWKPHPRNAFAEGGRAMLGQAGYGAALNFFIEFSTEINRKIGAKRK
jgi:hypothetical protein